MGPIVCVIGSGGQSITVPLQWDGMGPLGLYVGWGWDGKLGRLASMGTTWESAKIEMGWDGMRLMCHTVRGRRWDCHGQCGIVREIQYGTTRPQQPTPNEKQTIYQVR